MKNVQIQINHSEILSASELSSALYNEIGEENDLSEEDVAGYFHIDHSFLIPDGTFISVFTLDFPDVILRDQTPQDVIIAYLNSLELDDNIIQIVKTSDFSLFTRVRLYYEQIIELEMELRNVLTYIMTYDQRPIDETLFECFGIGLVKSHDPDNASKQYENGFFYILFNQYPRFLEPKKPTDRQVADVLRDPTVLTFEMFRERLIQRGISEERHINFLSSIATQMESIEKMRNAIMHCRNLSNRVVQNYEKATVEGSEDSIWNKIVDFWYQENESLKKDTWLGLARSQIKKTVAIETDQSGLPHYCTQSEQFIFELEETYDDVEVLRSDLVPYLVDKIEMENFDPTNPEFKAELIEVVNSVLVGLATEQTETQ